MAEYNYSRQREAIYSFLMTRKDHPTAEVVYQNVRELFPKISLGTVYRNLTLLSEIGQINKLHFEDGLDHYDADVSPHHHFLCTRCGMVTDFAIPIPILPALDVAQIEGFDGQITGQVTYFQGICPSCMKEKE